MSLIILIILCGWHAIIGTFIFIRNRYEELSPDSRWAWVDRIMFFSFLTVYIIIHLALILWFFRLFSKRRSHMKTLENHYSELVSRTKEKRRWSEISIQCDATGKIASV